MSFCHAKTAESGRDGVLVCVRESFWKPECCAPGASLAHMSPTELLASSRLSSSWAVVLAIGLTLSYVLAAYGLLRALAFFASRARARAVQSRTHRTQSAAGPHIVRQTLRAFCLLAALLGNRLVLPEIRAFAPLPKTLGLGLTLACIVAFSWFLLQLGRGVRLWLDDEFDISAPDNLRSRRMRTQIGFIEKIFDLIVVIVTLAVILAQFESGRKLSTGLLASAGVASLVIGLAAQRTIANLIAGFQIAFTQPIRIDDAVVVEDEWGWVEEISLTHVVVRIWDLRRLVLPITYFVEKPFQNWTRKSGQILGSVFLEVAHHTPFDSVEAELNRLLDEHPLWDRDARVLQVVDAKERSVQLRALMTARNSPQCWDLRCDIRRGLLDFLVREHPDCLPSARVALVQGAALGSLEREPVPRESWTAPAPSSPFSRG